MDGVLVLFNSASDGEMAVIIDQGMREMLVEQKDAFCYVTLINEKRRSQPEKNCSWSSFT